MEKSKDFEEQKEKFLRRDHWDRLEEQIGRLRDQYEQDRAAGRGAGIFEQMEPILETGHFNDVLAYVAFELAALMHHRVRYTDAVTPEGEFGVEYHERMAVARDLLLAAQFLMSGEKDAKGISMAMIEHLVDRVNRSEN